MNNPIRPKLCDKNGIEIELQSLEWQQTYLGWMEGDPEYMNASILSEDLPKILSKWPFIPHLIINADERRSLSEVFGVGDSEQQEKKYLPGEMAVVYLSSSWCPDEESDESRLIVAWFQDPSDPFITLTEIIPNIDWKTNAIGWFD